VNESLRKGVPPPADACRLTVCVPARNEASFIEEALIALSDQRDIDGRPLPPGLYDIIVFANNCEDGTADVVRRIARRSAQVAIFTVESVLPPDQSHIGAARKQIMDFAAERFLAAGRADGILASIDSDTIAQTDWIAWMIREMRRADAVAGQVTIAGAAYESLLAPVRLLYARELTYRRVLAQAEALIDPRPEDPEPRHNAFVGASFAVAVSAYIAAAGIPPVPRLEDLAFSHALRRIDARVRHSPAVRASTSARLTARVDGGFGTFLADLHDCARRGESFKVEHPLGSLDDMTVRAAMRRIRLGEERPDNIERAASILGLAAGGWLPLIHSGLPFGAACDAVTERAASGRRSYRMVPVEFAIATLRAAVADERSRQLVGLSDDGTESRDAAG
jgi:hypothetical protein